MTNSERSLRVLDGAVVVIDAVNGVETQSETVWHQSNKFNIAKIIFVNKLDRVGADFYGAVQSIKVRMQVKTLIGQMVLMNNEEITHLVDLVGMKKIRWMDELGNTVQIDPIQDDDPDFTEATLRRDELIETLAEFDEKIMEKYLEGQTINELELKQGIRRALRDFPNEVTFILCGSALKNRGIQPLIQSIVDYLPAPSDRLEFEMISQKTGAKRKLRASDHRLAALAFKSLSNKDVGNLTYVRMYSGCIEVGKPFFNATRGLKETASKIYRVRADEYKEINKIEIGDIAALTGLTQTKSGDTLMGGQDSSTYIIAGVDVPEPVFMSSFELETNTTDTNLQFAMNSLMSEDPSFGYEKDQESGQFILKGLGELHLQIMKERLQSEFAIKGKLTKLRVSYRETITRDANHEEEIIKKVQGYLQYLKLGVNVTPIEPIDEVSPPIQITGSSKVERNSVIIDLEGNNQIEIKVFDRPESANAYNMFRRVFLGLVTPQEASKIGYDYTNNPCPAKVVDSVILGSSSVECFDLSSLDFESIISLEMIAINCLKRGPLLGKQMLNTRIILESGRFTKKATSKVMFEMTANNIISKALSLGSPTKMEPVLSMTLLTPEHHSQKVINDIISMRRGAILEVLSPELTSNKRKHYEIHAEIPLEMTIGYANSLRSFTNVYFK